MRRSVFILTLLCGVLLVNVIAPVQGQISTNAFTVDTTTNPATSTQPDGSSADIATGETVTLRIQFVLPESTTISLRIGTAFGTNFTYVSNSARVSYLAGTLPSLTGDFAGIQNEAEPSVAFPASRVTVAGSTLSFDFGSVINNDGDGDDENIIIEYDLVPAVGAVSGTAVNLTYTIVIDEGLPTEVITTSNQITLNLVDPPGVTVTQSGGSTAVTEGGATDSFTVVLTSLPTADVTITVTPNAQVTVDKPTLTFTTLDWGTAQTVTVTAVDDNVAEGSPHSGAITFAAAGGGYTGLSIAPLSVSITDNDNSGISIAPLSFQLTEGLTNSYTIHLLTTPSVAPITVLVEFPTDQVSVNGNSAPFTLDFSDTTPQTVTFSVLANSANNTPREITIRHTITSSGAGEYPLGAQAVVTLAIDDLPPPPASPTCASENFSADGIVRTGVPDGLADAINCRVLYYNGGATTWLGSPLYSAATLGVPGLLDLGVLQAVDIFSPPAQQFDLFPERDRCVFARRRHADLAGGAQFPAQRGDHRQLQCAGVSELHLRDAL